MSGVVAWLLFGLGVAHVAYGLVKFRAPLSQAVAAGFVGVATKGGGFWDRAHFS